MNTEPKHPDVTVQLTGPTVGRRIGRAMARDVLAESMPREWTGLDPQDADQIPAGIDVAAVEAHAERAYADALAEAYSPEIDHEHEGGKCPHCGEKARLRVCCVCGVERWTIDCGHYDQPRPLAADPGRSGRVYCDDCFAAFGVAVLKEGR